MVWSVLLIGLVTGYLVLDGAVIGAGLLAPWLCRDAGERRVLRRAVGPFFLGAEVWVVAVLGVLLGVFPTVEGELFTALFPLVVLVLGSLVTRDAGMWLRGRLEAPGWQRTWDTVTTLGSAGLAVGWGLVLGALVAGLPGADHPGAALVTPLGLCCAAVFVAVLAQHGAAFAAVRATGPVASRAAALARVLPVPLAVGVLACAGIAAGTSAAPGPTALVATVLAALVLVTTRAVGTPRRHRRRDRRTGTTLVASAVALALTVAAAATGAGPRVAVSLADPATLAVLGAALGPVLVVLAAAQLWLWSAVARPVGASEPEYF